jgi:hypothetical protein
MPEFEPTVGNSLRWKTILKETLRWLTIVFFGGIGLLGVFEAVSSPSGSVASHWFARLCMLVLALPLAGVPLLISYLAFRRDYRALAGAAAMIGAIVLWLALESLEERLKSLEVARKFLESPSDEPPWLIVTAVFCFFGPILAGVSFYHGCSRLIDRRFGRRPKNGPTMPTSVPADSLGN